MTSKLQQILINENKIKLRQQRTTNWNKSQQIRIHENKIIINDKYENKTSTNLSAAFDSLQHYTFINILSVYA